MALWNRDCGHAERLWFWWRTTVASRVARWIGKRVGRTPWVAEDAAPDDRDQSDLPAGKPLCAAERSRKRRNTRRPNRRGQPLALAAKPTADRSRSDSRCG